MKLPWRVERAYRLTILCPDDEAALSRWWRWRTHTQMLMRGFVHKGGWRYEGWRLRIVRETD